MNILSIVSKNIKNFITKNAVVFGIMFTALVVSTVTILYVIVKLDTLSDKASAGNMTLDQISLNNKSQMSIDDISDRLQSYYEDNNSVTDICGLIEGDKCYVSCFITDEKKNLENFSQQSKPLDGKFFSDKDIEDGNDVMITVGMGVGLKSNKIGDTEIKVIGNFGTNHRANGYIPQKTVIKNNIIPESYKITYDHDLTTKQTKDYKAELEELFPEMKVETEMDQMLENGPLLLEFDNICLIVMAIVAVISCAYLYSYIIHMRTKEIYVFKICGSSPWRLVSIFLCELSFILIAQFIVAYLIFRLVIMQILKNYDFAFTYGYSWVHTALTFVIITVLSLVVFLPVLLYYCKKNAIEIKQKG